MDFVTLPVIPLEFDTPYVPTGNEPIVGDPISFYDLFYEIDDSEYGNDDPFNFYGTGDDLTSDVETETIVGFTWGDLVSDAFATLFS